MVFNGVKPPDAENAETRVRRFGTCCVPEVRIDSQAMHQKFVRIYFRIARTNVAPVELGNGHAELAFLQLAIKIISSHKKIGAVQRHAESDVQKPRGDHA